MLGAAAGGSGGVINLGFQVYLQDNFSGPAAGIKSTLDGLKDEANMHVENLTALRNVVGGAGAAALFLTRGIVEAAIEGAEFLHTMQGVLAISEATVGEFENLKTLAIELGRETIFTPDEVASGMRFMAMAGQTAKQIQATASDATYLAAATLTQLGGKMGAADILTNALKAFGLAVEDSTAMSDMLTFATTRSNVQLVDLGNSIRYVAATSRNLNIPVQDTLGMLMTLGNAGIQASMAGTALENMYRYLAMSVSEFATLRQQTTWQKIGLSRADVMTATGQFKPMVEVLGMIKKATEGMGAVDVQNVMKEIFGVRGQRAAGTIMRNLEESGKFIDQLHSGSIRGTAARKSAIMMESLKGSIEKVTSAWEGFKVAMAEALGDSGMNKLLIGLSKLIGMMETLLRNPIVKWAFAITTAFLGFAGVVLTVKAAIWTLALAMSKLRVSMAGMVAAGTMGTSALLGRGATVAGAGAYGGAAGSAGFIGYKAMDKMGAPRDANMRYSEKRGMLYYTSPGKPGAKWVPKATAASALGKGSMMGGAGWLGKLAGAAGGIMSWLAGPGMIIIMLTLTVLPLLISGISSLIGATNKNTEALKAKDEFQPKLAEVSQMIQNRTLGSIMQSINLALQRLIDSGKMTAEEARALLADQNRYLEVLILSVNEGNFNKLPKYNNPSSNKPTP